MRCRQCAQCSGSKVTAVSALPTSSRTAPCVALRDVVCKYGRYDGNDTTVRLPDITIYAGEHTLLLGPSGSGKTTLINAMTGLQAVHAGQVMVDGESISALSATDRDALRGKKMGLVMQRLHLIAALTVRGNLRMAQRLTGAAVSDNTINHVLQSLNIADKHNRYPRQLSQGEAQRAAIARALVNQPMLLLADEPTSALDDVNANAAIRLLYEQAAIQGATLVVATHDGRIKPWFKHVISLGDPVGSGDLSGTVSDHE